MHSQAPKDDAVTVQPADVLTLASKTDIKVSFPPDMPRPAQAVLLCTYFITIPGDGVPQVTDDVKFLVGNGKDMPQGEWKHVYNLSHAMIHQSVEFTSDGIVFPTGWDGVPAIMGETTDTITDERETVYARRIDPPLKAAVAEVRPKDEVSA